MRSMGGVLLSAPDERLMEAKIIENIFDKKVKAIADQREDRLKMSEQIGHHLYEVQKKEPSSFRTDGMERERTQTLGKGREGQGREDWGNLGERPGEKMVRRKRG